MKKIFSFIINFFEKNGLLKIIASFILLIICSIVIIQTNSLQVLKIFKFIVLIPTAYIIISFLLLFIAGIIGEINDIKEEKENKEK